MDKTERYEELLDELGKEARASELVSGDLYREFGMEPAVVKVRNDHGDTVLLTHEDDVQVAIDMDTVVLRVPAYRLPTR